MGRAERWDARERILPWNLVCAKLQVMTIRHKSLRQSILRATRQSLTVYRRCTRIVIERGTVFMCCENETDVPH